jgi:hypothetical protein
MVDQIGNMMDRHKVIRRIIIGFTLWMTYDAYQWAKGFAAIAIAANPENGQWAGALVQAIPTLLASAILTSYAKNSGE